MNQSPVFHVGASVEAVEAARDAIVTILDKPHGGRTIRAALRAFVTVCEVKNADLHDITVNVSGTLGESSMKWVETEAPR